MPDTNAPVWIGSEPANIEAAASDALAWLRELRERGVYTELVTHNEERAKFGRCVVALSHFVALLPDEQYQSAPSGSGAVCEVIGSVFVKEAI